MACLWQYYELSEIPCYVHTMPGLLKVLQTFVACLIFTFLSHTSLYLHQPALEWCVAVHSICFFPAALTILGNLIGWEYRLSVTFPIFRFLLTLLSVLLYVSALVLWLLYQFNEKFGGQPQRSNYMDCIDGLTYYIYHSAQCFFSDAYHYGRTGIDGNYSAGHAVCGMHGDAAHLTVSPVLGYLKNKFFAVMFYCYSVENFGQFIWFKLYIDYVPERGCCNQSSHLKVASPLLTRQQKFM